jgi:hypothetical protein
MASIDWGDGAITAGVVEGTAGSYTVSGVHTYLKEGTPTLKVTIQGWGPSIIVTAPVVVDEADSFSGTPVTISVVEGQQFGGKVATFANRYAGHRDGRDFAAMIDWGDGSALDTTSAMVGGGGASSTVGGTHTYARPSAAGSYPVLVTIKDVDGTALGQVTSWATVLDAPLVGQAIGTLETSTTTLLAGILGYVVDMDSAVAELDAAGLARQFAVTVDWGDGTSSRGTLGPEALDSGFGQGFGGAAGAAFAITGSHQYTEASLSGQPYRLTVAVADTGGSTVTISGAVVVRDGMTS